MKDYYFVDIEFINVDFNNYYIQGKKEVEKIHHTHIYVNDNEIELRIFYDDKTYFGEKLSYWAQGIAWEKFGTFIKTSNETKNDRVKKIDLSEAKLLSTQTSTSNYEGKSKFVVLKIDLIKFYWNSVQSELNTGEFYLNDIGFKVVKPFYSHLFGMNEKFNLRRMKGRNNKFRFEKCKFRPEFNAYSKDDRNTRVASVIKEPKIQFQYTTGTTEKDAIFYADVVKLLSRFYFNSHIDYIFCIIHLPEHTITIKKVEKHSVLDRNGSLWGFDNSWKFDEFIKFKWQKNILKNYQLLEKIIELFNQASLVDNNSEYLIRYNIIELCNKQKPTTEKFKEKLKGTKKKAKYDQALKLLLETVDELEHKDFLNKWTSLKGKLEYKPIKSPLVTFLESQDLNVSEFPISVNRLKEIRDALTHGSLNKINNEELRRANILLYRINGILILNLIGIKDWKLKTELN